MGSAQRRNTHTPLIKAILAHFGDCRRSDGLPVMRLWSNNSGAATTKRGRFVRYGVPPQGGGADLLGILGGRFLAVEVKTGRGSMTPLQEDFRDAVLECGGEHVVVRENDWQAVLQSLVDGAANTVE